VVTIWTTKLNIHISTFCPHSVFTGFVWISGHTAIISLHNINCLVFITEIQHFTAQWLLYVPLRDIHNSTFCPRSVFTCFVWISEQTEIISVYSINWLDFVTEKESVYSAVRTGSLNQTDTVLSLKG
jgi:hypothetical protein